MNKIIRFAIRLIVLTIIAFGLHYGSVYIFDYVELWNTSPINLLQIYFLQFILSLVTILAIYAINNVAYNNTGFVFLGLVALRMIASYLFIKPIVEVGDNFEFVKYHFLLIFFLYLTFDVYVTYILLKENSDVEKNSTKQ